MLPDMKAYSLDLCTRVVAAIDGGMPRTQAQEALLRFQLEQFSDATLPEHAERWNADHGTTLSAWTLGRAIRRLGWSRKKETESQ